jgi:hypothetical protein
MKMVSLFFWNLEEEIDRLTRNVGNELPLYVALCPRRGQIASASQRKPEMRQMRGKCATKYNIKMLHFNLRLHSYVYRGCQAGYYFRLQHKVTEFSNGEGMSLLRGTGCIFKNVTG